MPTANQIVPFAIALIAFVLYIAAAATCSWEKAESGSVKTTYGLWKICSEGPGFSTTTSTDSGKQCSDLEGTAKDSCQKRDALKAFTVMACIFAGVVTLLLLINMFRKLGSKLVVVILFLCATVSGIIAMAIAADMHDKYFKDFSYKLDAGFGLVIVGWILCLVGTLFAQFKGEA